MRTETAVAITGGELQGADPKGMATRWAAVLGLSAEPANGGWRIGLDGGELRFVADKDGRGDGLAAFDVAVHDIAGVQARARARGCVDAEGAVVLCGTRVRLVQA